MNEYDDKAVQAFSFMRQILSSEGSARLSDNKCKQIVRELAVKHEVDPRLITTRLLSAEDKNDMRNGDLPIEALDKFIEVWVWMGMPDQMRQN